MNLKTKKTYLRDVRNTNMQTVYTQLMKTPGAQSTAVIDKIATDFKVAKATVRRAIKGLTKEYTKVSK